MKVRDVMTYGVIGVPENTEHRRAGRDDVAVRA